ncbi:acyl-CoA thioester hydrolase [Halomicrobium zhouii]|uniref:Acyl-CoA thioester hydrolase n=1 Tax=Halomicrobium zhouii TaxID=767519 RepID=A0A1I6L7K9_9EURY|nr:thioesterase family protein [Halomicrobium zhouii]SFR99230.1 acyl-CoA thioester hydrolase [Halomicrobium zhouii]
MSSEDPAFEFETTVAVRYSDVDTYGHVNNATYATYLEEARIDYLEEVLGDEARSLAAESAEGDGGGAAVGVVVASLDIQYRHSVGLVDSVSVGVRVPRLGDASFPIEYEIRSDGDVAAEGTTTMVAYDREAGKSRPLPDSWRERIASFEGL